MHLYSLILSWVLLYMHGQTLITGRINLIIHRASLLLSGHWLDL